LVKRWCATLKMRRKGSHLKINDLLRGKRDKQLGLGFRRVDRKEKTAGTGKPKIDHKPNSKMGTNGKRKREKSAATPIL